MNVGLFTALAGTVIPAGIDLIRTSGFHTAGKGVAQYVRTTDTLASWGQGLWWQASSDGAKWKLAESVPTSDMFGTFGNADRAFGSDVLTGTDVTLLLNAFTWYLELFGFKRGILSNGNHRTSNTIHVGRGHANFASVLLDGETPLPASALGGFPAARVLTDRNDRPCFNVQGARGSGVTNIYAYGPMLKHVNDNRLGLCAGTGPAILDTSPSAWLPAGANHTQGRYNSGCGFAVDAYSGTRPTGSYPDAPYAAYESATTQWNKNFSSGISFAGSRAAGFSAGVICQPSDSDGNGDFIDLSDFEAQYCTWAISVGNSQCRGLNTSNFKWVFCHTVLTGVTHGRQIGYVSGNHSNWSGGHQIQLISYSTGFSGPLSIRDGYFEGGWRIGDILGNGPAFLLENCRFDFTAGEGAEILRGRPWNHIGLGNQNPNLALAPVRIRGGEMALRSLLIINSIDVETDCDILARDRDSQPTLPRYLAMAHNALSGGWAVPRFGGAANQTAKIGSRYNIFNVVTGSQFGRARNDGVTFTGSSRNFCSPAYTTQLLPSGYHKPITACTEITAIGDSSFTTKTLTGRVLKLVYPTVNPELRERLNLAPGDIAWHSASGVWGFISSFNDATDEIVIKIQNGFLENGATISWPHGTPTFTSGTFRFYSGRHYLPGNALTGNFTSGSAVINNVQDASGAVGNLATEVGVGDYFLIDRAGEGLFLSEASAITAVNAAAKTITVGVPAVKTGAGRRLIFRMGGIPNVANP